MNEIKPKCTGCDRYADELEEYIEAATDCGMSPDEYCMAEEGTYNATNGHFLCTDCYIKAGMPAVPHPGQWIAP